MFFLFFFCSPQNSGCTMRRESPFSEVRLSFWLRAWTNESPAPCVYKRQNKFHVLFSPTSCLLLPPTDWMPEEHHERCGPLCRHVRVLPQHWTEEPHGRSSTIESNSGANPELEEGVFTRQIETNKQWWFKDRKCLRIPQEVTSCSGLTKSSSVCSELLQEFAWSAGFFKGICFDLSSFSTDTHHLQGWNRHVIIWYRHCVPGGRCQQVGW